ncbi:MAG: hypothetical protein WCF95_03540 [bacterium]
MQIQRITNCCAPTKKRSEPTFNGIHIVRVSPNITKTTKNPEILTARAKDATEYIQEIFMPFSRIVQETVMSVKDMAKSTFGLEFPKGNEGFEDAFTAFVEKAQDDFPDVIKHEILEDVPTGTSVVEEVAKRTNTHPRIGFVVSNDEDIVSERFLQKSRKP